MMINKKIAVAAGLFGAMALGIAASMPQERQEPKLVNLKVFPKNIPFRVLDHTMDVWSASLGVHCNFCHVRNEQTNKMDFASDAKPEKKIARQMLRMTLDMNKIYFKIDSPMVGTANIAVTCNTCHRGDTFPEQPGNGKN